MTDPLDQLGPSDGDEEDLWLISYADLLTLLIAFFAMALAATAADTRALERAAEALGVKTADSSSMQALRADLEDLVREQPQSARLTDDARGVSLVLGDALLFDVGSDALKPEAEAWLAKVAGRLRLLEGRQIVIEGHTDDVPIHTARYTSNWALASSRALSVVHLLERHGVRREQMSVVSLADTRPAVTHGPLGSRRAANRRVVIRVE